MKHILSLLLFLFLSLFCFSQIKYEKGYFIDKTGNKTECLVKFEDWKKLPKEFKYKLSENAEPTSLKMTEVTELVVYNLAKYKWLVVKIDRSGDNADQLNQEAEPEFKEERVLLKTLIEGNASLYQYKEKTLNRYFFSTNGSDIQPFIYKKYLQEDNKIKANETYKQQLKANIDCSAISFKDFQELKYTQRYFIKHFRKYYACTGETFIDYGPSSEASRFNLNIRPGLSFNSLSLGNGTNQYSNAGFAESIGYWLGVETEFIMPFGRDTWSILLEPAFRSYSSDKLNGPQKAELNTKSFMMSLGLRYFFAHKKDFDFYISGNLVLDFPFNSGIAFENEQEISASSVLRLPSLHLGFRLKDTYSLEIRYWPNSYVFDGRLAPVKYNTVHLIAGFQIF